VGELVENGRWAETVIMWVFLIGRFNARHGKEEPFFRKVLLLAVDRRARLSPAATYMHA
jgi:hypothetical protein